MYLKIKSKYAPTGVFEFRAPHAGGHVSLSVDGQWRQICHGGGFLGWTIEAPENIGPSCRKWLAQYRRLDGGLNDA